MMGSADRFSVNNDAKQGREGGGGREWGGGREPQIKNVGGTAPNFKK